MFKTLEHLLKLPELNCQNCSGFSLENCSRTILEHVFKNTNMKQF